MNWRDHITVDPTICHGKARIRGTRVIPHREQSSGTWFHTIGWIANVSFAEYGSRRSRVQEKVEPRFVITRPRRAD